MNVGRRRGGEGGGGWVRFGHPNKAHYNLMRGQAICGAAKCRQSAQHSPNAMWTERTRDRAQGEGRTTNQQTKLLPPRPDGAHTVYCIWNITELWRYAAVLENWQLCSRVSTLPFCQLFEMNCFCFPLSVPPCSPFPVASLRQNTQKITLSEKWN